MELNLNPGGKYRKSPLKQGFEHFVLQVEGKKIVYCYIRKNACSAFRDMFIGLSGTGGTRDDAIDYMKKNCQLTDMAQLKESTHQICVLRDPIARAISLYKHKMIAQIGNEPMIRKMREKVTKRPFDMTFENFVEGYLTLPQGMTDPHAWPQRAHLMPIVYNSAININNLHAEMKKIIGDELADRYFKTKTNDTSTSDGDKDGDSRKAYLGNVSASELRDEYLKSKSMPSEESLISLRSAQIISTVYAQDYELMNRLGKAQKAKQERKGANGSQSTPAKRHQAAPVVSLSPAEPASV